MSKACLSSATNASSLVKRLRDDDKLGLASGCIIELLLKLLDKRGDVMILLLVLLLFCSEVLQTFSFSGVDC